jgi:glucuronosyltransferase
MKLSAVFVSAIVICTMRGLYAARILALFQNIGESHFLMFETLLKALAARGHDVVVVSHFPQHRPVENYTDISISGVSTRFNNSLNVTMLQNVHDALLPFVLIDNSLKTCEMVFKHPNIQTLLKSEDKFDLIITEIFVSDCFLGFVHKFKAPHISVMSSVPFPWASDRTGTPDHPAYVPNYFSQYTDKMSLWERLQNTAHLQMLKWVHFYCSELPTHRIATKYFGDNLPALSEIARNVSLVLVNSHFSMNYPRPTVPAVLEVGGLHIRSPSKLPQVCAVQTVSCM